MAEYALRLANAADTAARVRIADAMALQPRTGSAPLNARTGIRRDGGGVVTVSAGTMNLSVSPFVAWIDGTVSDVQGGYPFVLDAAKTLAVANGHATLSRIDTVAVVVRDTAYDSSGSTDATVQLVQGTAGSGVAPTLPANAVALRDVTVPAGASAGTGGLSSSNLGADRRPWLVAAGGVLPVASATERNALSALEGQAVWRLDTHALEVYDGTLWGTYVRDSGYKVLSGQATVSVTNANAGNVDIAFPGGFSGTPHLTVTSDSTGWYAVYQAKSGTSATLRAVQRDGTATTATITLDWIARGPR